jgi:DHA1 family solute carrier family 18 vesicular amine transporter 1/2
MSVQSERAKSGIFALYAMRFLTSSSFGVFGVIVPLYMRDLGVSFTGLGIAFSVFGVMMGVAGIFFGAHSDVVGRKPYLVLSLGLSAVVNFFYTRATGVVDLVILQALSGVSSSLSGMIIPALMTDLTKEVERGRKFGRMGGFGWLGVGLGYFLGGALSQFFGYHLSFIFVSMLSLISCLLVLLYVPSYHLPSQERFNLTFVKGFSPNLKTWLLISFITSLVIGPVEVMVIPSYVVDPGPLGIDKMVFGSFMSIGYIITSSTQFIGGSLADKYNRRKLASIFYLVPAPFIMVQPLSLSFPYFASMYVLEGIGEGLNHPCSNAIVASSVRPRHRGFDFSIISLLGNVGSTLGFLGMGFVLDNTGFVYPFFIRAIAYVLVSTLIYLKIKD